MQTLVPLERTLDASGDLQVAYRATEGGVLFDAPREHLVAWLPDFMPSWTIATLDSLARTPSIEIDGRSLPDPDRLAHEELSDKEAERLLAGEGQPPEA